MIAACVRLRFPPFVLCWSHLIFKYFFLPGDLRHLRDLLNVVAVLLFIFVLIFLWHFSFFLECSQGEVTSPAKLSTPGKLSGEGGGVCQGVLANKIAIHPEIVRCPCLAEVVG